jgi:hypothetical protein
MVEEYCLLGCFHGGIIIDVWTDKENKRFQHILRLYTGTGIQTASHPEGNSKSKGIPVTGRGGL